MPPRRKPNIVKVEEIKECAAGEQPTSKTHIDKQKDREMVRDAVVAALGAPLDVVPVTTAAERVSLSDEPEWNGFTLHMLGLPHTITCDEFR